MATLIEVLGWLGAIALVSAYVLVSRDVVSARSGRYQGLNIAAGVLLTSNALWHGAWPLVALNLTWIAIGVATVVRGRPPSPA